MKTKGMWKFVRFIVPYRRGVVVEKLCLSGLRNMIPWGPDQGPPRSEMGMRMCCSGILAKQKKGGKNHPIFVI